MNEKYILKIKREKNKPKLTIQWQ